MNDEKLKAMWNKTENVMRTSGYKSSSIREFLSRKSNDTAQKIKNMIIFDIALKTFLVVIFGIDIVLYFGVNNIIAVCFAGIILLALLLLTQFKMLKRFKRVANHNQNTRDNLTSMLAYLKTKFYSTLLAVSATYLFVFIGGSLMYFYVAHGEVRPLDGIDVIVFLGFILIGIGFNFFVNKAQVKYHVKHLELCLSELNDNAMVYASENIELQRKQDRINKFLLALILVIGFMLLIAVLLNAFG